MSYTEKDNNQRAIFNKMVQNALLEFSSQNSGEDEELELPAPRVFLSAGIQFLISMFNATELISTIGHALQTEKVTDVDGEEPRTILWFYENKFETPFPLAKVGAYLPEWGDAYEYYKDGFSLTKDSLFCESVNSSEFENISKLVICSHYDSNKGDYFLYLPNEASIPEIPESAPALAIPVETSTDIPF